MKRRGVIFVVTHLLGFSVLGTAVYLISGVVLPAVFVYGMVFTSYCTMRSVSPSLGRATERSELPSVPVPWQPVVDRYLHDEDVSAAGTARFLLEMDDWTP